MENAKKFYELDDKAQLLKQRAEAKLIDVAKQKNFKALLEVGCGNGHFLINFPLNKIEGIEISKEMIDESGNLKNYIVHADITDCNNFIKKRIGKYDLITSNYVFTELTGISLKKAFKNIYKLLHPKKGRFIFTITDPRTRDRITFPGYKLVFFQPYDYKKKDLEFKVLLKTDEGYRDVGIVDYHRPIEDYDHFLKEVGFKDIKRENIYFKEGNERISYAVFYSAHV